MKKENVKETSNQVTNFLNSCEMQEIIKTRKNDNGIYKSLQFFIDNDLTTFLKNDNTKLNRSKIRRYFHNLLDNATICKNGEYFANNLETIKSFLGFAKNIFVVFEQSKDFDKILDITNFCQSTDKDTYNTTKKQIEAIKKFIIENL